MMERAQAIRHYFAALVLLAAFGRLGAKLVSLHLGPNPWLREHMEQSRIATTPIKVGRGRILDRNGRVLAMDVPRQRVIVNPTAIRSAGIEEEVAARLAMTLQLDPATLLGRLRSNPTRYANIAPWAPDEAVNEIRRQKIPYVDFQPSFQRVYPAGRLAAHVIGFVSQEEQPRALAGIELRMDAWLAGQDGLRRSEVDGVRQEVYARRLLEIAPREGADVVLTLDATLQEIVEQRLDEMLPKTQADAGWVVVQEVRTGRILAMASRPAFDPAAYATAGENEFMNRPIGYLYEPGSTFKVAVIAAALDAGVVTPDQVFDCENGLWHYRGRPLRDYHPYGRLTVADIVKKSSNIGAAKIALELGEERLETALRRFGFGQRTGIDLPGEQAGLLWPRRRWTSLSITRIPMGHEVAVTSLQMLNAVCAIANDGFLMRPFIVQRVVDAEGRVLQETEPEVLSRPLSEKGARLMCRLMERVTEPGGTGTRAAVPGYRVAGKTGTAQKPLPGGGYSDTLNISSFVGFLPAENPVIAILVVLDSPRGERTGGATAAPIFSAIAAEAVNCLGIPSDGRPRVIDPTLDASTPQTEEDSRDPRTVVR